MTGDFTDAYTETIISPNPPLSTPAGGNANPRLDNAGRDLPPLETIRADAFAGKPVPEREFHVPGRVPCRTVTMLSGDGGAGKSLIALQLAVATVSGTTWCGQQVKSGPVLYLAAEDDTDELHRRLYAICNGLGIGVDRLHDLHLVPLAGADALLAIPDTKGVLKPTELARRVEAKIAELRPALVIGDTLADLFGGQEIERAAARQFIGILRGWALRYNLAFLLLAHPSLTGISTGSGLSGSTAWNNSVRSRLYLERVKSDDKFEADPDLRVLRTLKANYGPIGGEVRLRYRDGMFVALDRLAEAALGELAAPWRAEQVFLDVLFALTSEGRVVSPHPTSHNYAPTIMARDRRAAGFAKPGLEAAMRRLFSDGRIHIGKSSGPPSKQTDIVVPSP